MPGSVWEGPGWSLPGQLVAEAGDGRADLAHQDRALQPVEVEVRAGQDGQVDAEVQRRQRIDEQFAASGALGEPYVVELPPRTAAATDPMSVPPSTSTTASAPPRCSSSAR